VPVVPLPGAAIPAASVLAKAAATTVAIGDKEEEVDSWLLLSKHPESNASSSNNIISNSNNNISSSSNNDNKYFGEVDEYFDLVSYNSYCDKHINNNPEQYRRQEQELMQKEFGYKEAGECVVPSQVVMTNEQQQQRYVGSEQTASMTTGVSTYTTSISNSVSSSITLLSYVMHLF
jgi:hypothetical protein